MLNSCLTQRTHYCRRQEDAHEEHKRGNEQPQKFRAAHERLE